jgi:hypothetical protein
MSAVFYLSVAPSRPNDLVIEVGSAAHFKARPAAERFLTL